MDSVFEIAGILPLTPENSEIVEEGDFPVLYLLDDKGKKERLGLIEIKRAFPFEQDWEFLVLSDEEGKDCGFIRNLKDRSAAEQELIRKELNRRYYMPVIEEILKVVDRFGFSYWTVKTPGGPLEFSVRDPYKSILHLGNRLLITDADGNRYESPDVTALKKSDLRKIELDRY